MPTGTPQKNFMIMKMSSLIPKPARCAQKHRKKLSFLDLPGEIRNQIYQCHFSNFRVEIMRQNTCLPFYHPNSVERYVVLDWYERYFRNNPVLRNERQRETKVNKALLERIRWATSMTAILLVNKQVHKEALSLLYESTTFVFASNWYLNSFMRIVPKASLAFIRTLELHYESYGDPSLVEDTAFKRKSDDRWLQTCRLAAKQLTGLKSLTLYLHLNDRPLRLRRDEAWVKPLFEFRRLGIHLPPKGRGGKLESVAMRISWRPSKAHRTLRRRRLYWAEMVSEKHRCLLDNLHRLYESFFEKIILGHSVQSAWEEYLALSKALWKDDATPGLKPSLYQFGCRFDNCGPF